MKAYFEWLEFWRVYTLLGVTALCCGVSGCQTTLTPGEVTSINGAVTAGNTAGAIIAGVINPAIAIPAGAAAGALNASNCAITKNLGGTC